MTAEDDDDDDANECRFFLEDDLGESRCRRFEGGSCCVRGL